MNLLNIGKNNQIKQIFISGTNGLTASYGGWDQLLIHVSETLSSTYKVTCHGSIFDVDPSKEGKFRANIKLFNCSATAPPPIIITRL